jgi:hypothetical protein
LLFNGQQTRNVQNRLARPRRLVDYVLLGFVSRGFAQADRALLPLNAEQHRIVLVSMLETYRDEQRVCVLAVDAEK